VEYYTHPRAIRREHAIVALRRVASSGVVLRNQGRTGDGRDLNCLHAVHDLLQLGRCDTDTCKTNSLLFHLPLGYLKRSTLFIFPRFPSYTIFELTMTGAGCASLLCTCTRDANARHLAKGQHGLLARHHLACCHPAPFSTPIRHTSPLLRRTA